VEVLEALQPYRPYWRGILLLVVLVAVSLSVYHFFFACPRVQASAPPDHLEVKQTIAASNGFSQAPGDWTFGARQAQEVLSAIDSLPAATTDYRYCPLSDGTVFGYTFWQGQTIVLLASAQEGGCHVLDLSDCDIRQEDGNFVLLMEGLLGLPAV
jgi:hypothetical protein